MQSSRSLRENFGRKNLPTAFATCRMEKFEGEFTLYYRIVSNAVVKNHYIDFTIFPFQEISTENSKLEFHPIYPIRITHFKSTDDQSSFKLAKNF